VLGLLECKGEGVEFLGRPEPDETAFAHVDVRLEDLFIVVAGAAVHAVCRNQQVRVPEIGDIRDFMLEALVHAQLVGALLEQVQQPLTADSCESMTAADKAPPLAVDGNIVPVMEAASDGVVAFRVGGAEIPHGLVGKDHAPAESVVRAVPLVYFYTDLRQRPTQQNSCVQSRGAAAQAHYSPHPGRTPSRANHIASMSRMLYCQVLQVSIILSPIFCEN